MYFPMQIRHSNFNFRLKIDDMQEFNVKAHGNEYESPAHIVCIQNCNHASVDDIFVAMQLQKR